MYKGAEDGWCNIGKCREPGLGAGISRSKTQHPDHGRHASGHAAHEDRKLPTVRSDRHHTWEQFLRSQ